MCWTCRLCSGHSGVKMILQMLTTSPTSSTKKEAICGSLVATWRVENRICSSTSMSTVDKLQHSTLTPLLVTLVQASSQVSAPVQGSPSTLIKIACICLVDLPVKTLLSMISGSIQFSKIGGTLSTSMVTCRAQDAVIVFNFIVINYFYLVDLERWHRSQMNRSSSISIPALGNSLGKTKALFLAHKWKPLVVLWATLWTSQVRLLFLNIKKRRFQLWKCPTVIQL